MTTEQIEDLQDAAYRILGKAQELQTAGEFAEEWMVSVR
jgi:hypothetical protein